MYGLRWLNQPTADNSKKHALSHIHAYMHVWCFISSKGCQRILVEEQFETKQQMEVDPRHHHTDRMRESRLIQNQNIYISARVLHASYVINLWLHGNIIVLKSFHKHFGLLRERTYRLILLARHFHALNSHFSWRGKSMQRSLLFSKLITWQ